MAYERLVRMRTLLCLLGAASLVASVDMAPAPVQKTEGPFKVPFKVGERLTYAAKVNFMSAGTATMSVEGVEPIRGRPTYHTIFDVKGRVLFFHVDDHYESWFDTTDLVSLHHVQHID